MCSPLGVERVCRRVCQSDMRGLVTAGRDFRIGVGRCLEIERNPLQDNRVAHRTRAGHSHTLADTLGMAHPDSCVLISRS